jgi:uncharacterized protein YndB with AHSA1/START domain
MKRIEATHVVPAPPEAVFDFLSALENHWAVAGRWIEVVGLDRAPAATGGRVRIRGPLGLRRTATTRVELAEPPLRLQGTAQLGRTLARVSWALEPRGGDATEVRLAAVIVEAGAVDRALLALGASGWMRRLFAATLAHLADRFADEPPPAAEGAALSSARA